jgi:hypothetical protein
MTRREDTGLQARVDKWLRNYCERGHFTGGEQCGKCVPPAGKTRQADFTLAA